MSVFSGISVVMPVYNGGKFLSFAIESILQQTYENYEFIIINDGSTDNSFSIINSYAKKDSRIVAVNQPNMGIVASLNTGINISNFDLIARMDCDDISLPTRFSEQLQYLESHDECVLVGSSVVIIDSDGDEICNMGEYFQHDELEKGLLSKIGQLIYHPSVIMKKQAIVQVGGYRPQYSRVEDLDLFLRLAEVGKIHNLKTPLLKYREHNTKVGQTYSIEQQKQVDEVLEEARFKRGLPSLPKSSGTIQTVNEKEQTKNLGWWALKAGNIQASRKHARRFFLRNPGSLESWRLLYCSLRGH